MAAEPGSSLYASRFQLDRRSVAHVPLQLIQGDVSDRDAVLSRPVDFEQLLFWDF